MLGLTTHVLIVTPFSLQATGGVTSVVKNLSDQFCARGYNVSILVPATSDRVIEVGKWHAAPVYGCRLRAPDGHRSRLRSAMSFAVYCPLTLWRLFRHLKRQRVDVVLLQYPLPNMIYFAMLRLVSAWALVVTFQGNDAHDLNQRSAVETQLLKWLVWRADCVTAVAGSLLSKVRQALGRPRHSVIIPNGATVPHRPPDGTLLPVLAAKYLISVGQLIDRKGYDILIRALGLLRRHKAMHVEAVIVGEGPLRSSLEELADREGVRDSVNFVGSYPAELVFAMLERSTFLVLASRAEGFPLVIAEAMLAGRPVIATRIDGVPEIVRQGDTGLLVASEGPAELAAAIEHLWVDEATRDRMAASARALASGRYSWDHIATQYCAVMNSQLKPSAK